MLVGLVHFQLTQSIWMAFNTLTVAVASWLVEYFPVIFEPGMMANMNFQHGSAWSVGCKMDMP